MLVALTFACALAASDVDKLAHALAQFGAIESSHVGAAGRPSKAWAAFESLRKQLSRDDAVRLLSHSSSVVRGYLVSHVIREFPSEMRHIAPLLLDQTAVATMGGCIGGSTTIAEITAGSLCASKDRRARDVIERAQTKKRMTPAALRVVTARCYFED